MRQIDSSLAAFVLFASVPALAATGSASAPQVRVSGPVTWADGEAFWGPYVDLLAEVAPNLRVGGETGFLYWSSSLAGLSVSEWVIPVLAKGLYSLDAAGAPGVHPYVGASVGAAFIHASISDRTDSVAGSGTRFAGFVHGGAEFGDERRFFFDLRLGVIASSFAIAPTFGVRF